MLILKHQPKPADTTDTTEIHWSEQNRFSSIGLVGAALLHLGTSKTDVRSLAMLVPPCCMLQLGSGRFWWFSSCRPIKFNFNSTFTPASSRQSACFMF